MITITSQIEGYRRCGIEHPARPTIYPDGHFTPEELATLKSTPVLNVVEVHEPQQQDDQNEMQQDKQEETQEEMTATLDPEQFKEYTVAELKDMATKMDLTFPAKATKKELIEMICKEPVIVPDPE